MGVCVTTIIAFDGKTLAADKYTWVSGVVALSTKIQRVNGHLVGVSGSNVIIPQIFAWAKNDFTEATMPLLQKDPKDHSDVMVITRYGQILMYENASIPWINERPFWAIGSGREFAIGAMAAKATAIEAVLIASEYAGNCGRGCDTLTLEEEQPS